MKPRPGLNASSQDCFELLQFTIDGEEKKIRRSERKTGQTYSVNLGDDVMRAGKPVRISHTYRTVTAKRSHGLYVAIAQPTRNISVTMDYTGTDIDKMYASELVSTAKRSRLATMPEEVPAKAVTIDVPGWILPPAQFTYVWSLASEQPPAKSAAAQDRAAA